MSQQTAAITKIVVRERDRLRSFIRHRVRLEEDADDILQDVFQQLVTSFETIESIERVGAWLFQVARNKIIDRARRGRVDTVTVSSPVEGEDLQLIDILPDPATTRKYPHLREVIFEALEEALLELPDNQREVFVMHEFDGLSFNDIAARTGDGVNTLLARKRYAVIHLRDALNDLYEDLLASESE